MARSSTWLLAAALVLAAACTANAQLQARRLIQKQAPYDDVAAAAQIQEVYQEAVRANVAACSATATGLFTGPSTEVRPYMVPVDCRVTTTSILTVGDSVGGYRLVGIPDGMGAYRLSEEKDDDKPGGNRKMGGNTGKDKGKGDGNQEEGNDIVLLANHELGETVGSERAHGAKGAFISKWTIDAKTLQVKKGEDLIKEVYNWNWLTKQYEQIGKYAFRRFCSADLADQRAFRWGNFGTKDRIFTNGEETGITGRAYAHIATGKDKGKTYQLPNFGWDSWENIVCRPYPGRQTVCIGLDDGGGSHQAVYVYVGDKKFNPRGDLPPVEAAGLVYGKLYGIRLVGLTSESFTEMPPQREYPFMLVEVTPDAVAPVFNASRVVSEATWQDWVKDPSREIMSWARPEDGGWNMDRLTDFYFLSTAQIDGVTKMWRLRFKNIRNVLEGGTATIIVNGLRGTPRNTSATPPIPNAIPNEAAPVMMDNLVVHKGFTYMQEDPGNNAILARIWEQDLSKTQSTGLKILARHDPCLYNSSVATPFVTADEESSGIISMDGLLKGRYSRDCFMVSQQTHLRLVNSTVAAPLYPDGVPPNLEELVEGGQLLLMCKNARTCSG